MSTNIFKNCTFHSNLEKLFENCTETNNPCHLLEEVHLVDLILKWFFYYFSAFVFILAGIMNIYTLSIIFPLFLKMTKRSQKRYIFLISRLFSSIVAIFVLVILRLISIIPESYNFTLIAILSVISGFSFFSLLGSYIGMAFIIYLGVAHPWFYEHDVTLRHIVYIGLGNYLVSMTLSLPTGILLTASYTNGPIKCDPIHCASIMAWIGFILASIAFTLTILILAYVLGLLFYNDYKSRRIYGNDVLAHAKSKVGWTLFAIVLVALGEGIPNSLLLGVNIDSNLSTCDSFYRADQLLLPTILSCLVTLIWALVLLIDPIMSIISDELVKREIRNQVNWSRLYYAKCLKRVYETKC